MKRREYLTGVAGVGALAAVGNVSAGATTSNHVLGTIADAEGDDYGPGTYTYPTNDEFKDGVYDMTGVTVTDEDDAWGFEVAIGGPVENPYSYDAGFSTQGMHLYIRDPDAGSDTPATTAGRAGVISNFAEAYHYRVVVQGNTQVVEAADAEAPADATVISEDVSASADADAGTISFSVPKSALGGGNLADKHAAMLMFSHDGFGTGGIRGGAPEAQQYRFGGITKEILNAPKVMDMIDPEGLVDQQDALSYSDSAKPTIPLFNIGEALNAGGSGSSGGSFSLPATATDAEGDDYGPGTYTYPTNDEFKDGVYDMTEVNLADDGDAVTFTVNIAGPVENPYSYDAGFSTQGMHLYVHDPDAGSDTPATTAGRAGVISNFAQPYHYRVVVQGNTQVVEAADAEAPADATVVSEDVSASADSEAGTISFTVPKSAIGGGGNLPDKRFALLMFSHDGFGTGGIRGGAPEAQQYRFGGIEGEILNAPKVMDLLDPDGVLDQQEALSYSDAEKPTIPLIRMADAFVPQSTGGGEEEEEPPARNPIDETVPGGEGPPTDIDQDGTLEDIDGDGDADVDDVRSLLFNRKSDTVQNNSGLFDQNGDGSVTIRDAAQLFRKIFS